MDAGHHGPDGIAQKIEPVVHLVDHGRPDGPDLVGGHQQGNLVVDLIEQVTGFLRRVGTLAQHIETRRQILLLVQNGSTPCVGGMGGKRGLNVEAVNDLKHLVV